MLRNSSRHRRAALTIGLTTVLIVPLAALGAGSPSIAAAPVAQSDVQHFGDTACCGAGGDPRNYSGQALSHREFWRLPLTAGDRVTLNWSSVNPDGVRIGVFTPATTDFNYADRDKVTVVSRGENSGKGQVTFTASRSGNWTLSIGTHWQVKTSVYDFAYTVKHFARLHLAALASVSRTGIVSLAVRAPDGTAITNAGLKLRLEGFWAKRWHVLATGTPKGGKASFRLRLAPALRGTTIKLRVRGTGTSFLSVTSQTRAVRIR